MKKYNKYVIHVLILSLVLVVVATEWQNFINNRGLEKTELKAQQGILDLSEWDFDERPLHTLDGEWCFFYQKFIKPDGEDILPDGFIRVPGLWNSFRYGGEEIGALAHGTYRLKVLLPPDSREKFALKVSDMSGSYRLFVNGTEISSNGVIGTSRQEEKPQWKPLVRSLNTNSDELDIVVHVSNYHHIKGGMWESLVLGTEEAIYKNRELNLLVSLVVSGVLFISVYYYLIIFAVIQSNMASLYLAAFSFMACLRELFVREVAILLPFPNLSFDLIAKLEYLTVPSGPLLLALAVYSLYRGSFPKKVLQVIVTVFAFYMVIILLTPLKIFAVLMDLYIILFVVTVVYLIYVVAKAAKSRRPGAGTLLFGMLFLFLTILLDIGYFYKLHNNYDLSYTFSIGLIILILCQMNSLSLYIAEVSQRAQQLAKTEMAFLQAQIVPHFLHNTLNTVIHLTRESPEKARDLLVELSNYLRGKFNFDLYKRNTSVSLKYELDIVKSYLAIEIVRFNDRLEIEYRIEEQALNCKILPFLLQPLVENAVRHGFKNKSDNCRLVISAMVQQNSLILSVADNGMGMPKEKILALTKADTNEHGTGLYNINQRLSAAYGANLSISSEIDKGTTISITIPSRSDPKHVKGSID